MAKINKVSEYKVKRSALEGHPIVACSECGCDTKLETIYFEVRTEIDMHEIDLIQLDFEEREVSKCCKEPVFLVDSDDNEIYGDDVYELIEF